ncbi:lysoplasmalogenase family protein [Erythrobacter sp.]|uniref:lysoplasmalogenase family protein n=1 Tax=Erythrobacter sp. TaxID=1042 RepID=UPI001425E4CF|nr:lysoplasmalogenase family protein [Erythrobacter sp.]QIQ86057.1 MAG: lysoplasmalogenase [Erythrobacter sp.]
MAKRALVEHRPWLLASVIAATAYYFLWNNPVGEGVWGILLKGAGVGLLAVYAMRRTRGVDGAILVIALALSAAGDMAIMLSFEAGGALFLLSHLVAVGLYARNLRENPAASQRLLALALVVAAPLLSWLLSARLDIAAYGAVLGAMAAGAWLSRFPRYRVGLGAVLFVASDWLLFSRLGPIDLAPLPDLFVWPLYYVGQVMIATGVVQTLRADHES